MVWGRCIGRAVGWGRCVGRGVGRDRLNSEGVGSRGPKEEEIAVLDGWGPP